MINLNINKKVHVSQVNYINVFFYNNNISFKNHIIIIIIIYVLKLSTDFV